MRSIPDPAPVPAGAAARAQADWYAFVLEELNGLGTMLRFQDHRRGAETADIEARVHAVLDTLAWDRDAALRQTWAFVATRLDQVEDAWGPSLVLRSMEPDQRRVRDWRARLAPEADAIIDETCLGLRSPDDRSTSP